MLAIGIDPGATGAVAFLDTVSGAAHGEVVDTKDVRALSDLIRQRLADEPNGTRILVGIESVHSMPKQGVASAFTFGRASMGAEAVVTLLGLPWVPVSPREWTAVALRNREKPKAKADRKKAILAAARQRWPGAGLDRVKDAAVGEALFMALTVAQNENGNG